MGGTLAAALVRDTLQHRSAGQDRAGAFQRSGGMDRLSALSMPERDQLFLHRSFEVARFIHGDEARQLVSGRCIADRYLAEGEIGREEAMVGLVSTCMMSLYLVTDQWGSIGLLAQ
jgi:hypothetical protein